MLAGNFGWALSPLVILRKRFATEESLNAAGWAALQDLEVR